MEFRSYVDREPAVLSVAAFVAMVVLFALALSQCGCGAFGEPATPAKCSDAELARIETEYITAMISVCRDMTFEECMSTPDGNAADARFDALREEWIQCR